MADCLNITKSFAGTTCKNNMGGIKTLWIAATPLIKELEPPIDMEETLPIDKWPLITLAEQTAVVPGATDSVLTSFWKFPLPIDLGDYVEDVTADPKLGVSFVTITINGTILGLSSSESLELSNMMKGAQTIIAELYDGKYVFLGEQNGLDMTGGGSRTGAEAASLQGYEVTWTGKEPYYARFIDESEVTAGVDVLTVGAVVLHT